MAGMKFTSFLLVSSSVIAVVLVVVTFWHSIFRDAWSFFFGVPLFLLFLASFLPVILFALFNRSRLSWWTISINVVAALSFFPMMNLGNMIRDDLFLANLATYQSLTDKMISERKVPSHDEFVQFPNGYWSILVRDRAVIEYNDADRSTTVIYTTGDSSAIGHAGYLYRSDDDQNAIHQKRPDIGLFRIAPKWYVWGT
jgi:hypothetical protein